MVKCSQCGKTAVVLIGDDQIPLCVSCFSTFQQAMEKRNRFLQEEINYLTESIEATFGLPGILPKYKIPQPIYHRHEGPVTLNNIKVDNSTIGAINTGEIANLDIAITHVKKLGDEALAEALNKFIQALIDERELKDKEKNQILEQLNFITNQINLPREQRKNSVIKSVFSSIKDGVSTIAGLLSLWERLYPLLQKIFM